VLILVFGDGMLKMETAVISETSAVFLLNAIIKDSFETYVKSPSKLEIICKLFHGFGGSNESITLGLGDKVKGFRTFRQALQLPSSSPSHPSPHLRPLYIVSKTLNRGTLKMAVEISAESFEPFFFCILSVLSTKDEAHVVCSSLIQKWKVKLCIVAGHSPPVISTRGRFLTSYGSLL
jgi:hypothetical protein